tara:strand:+ start:922 stop:1146 length:225 start_codon:yes stop_codon:yes gene_type:complete
MIIDFITAKNGAIEMFSNNTLVATARTAEQVAKAIREFGVERSVGASSSMDFADEEGFAHWDDANKLWIEGVTL